MAKAVFNRRFNATDTRRGISLRIEPEEAAQTLPEWVIRLAEKAGAATRVIKDKKPAPADTGEKEH